MDFFAAGLDSAVAVPGQHLGIALAGDDGANDGLAGHAQDIGQHLGELEVHLHQRLLPALHPAGLFDDQYRALAGHRAHYADLASRAPGRAQQPHRLISFCSH